MSTIPQSTTPRTDAAVRLTIGAGFNMVYPSFARELENELAHLRAEVERLKFYIATTIQPEEHAKVIKDLRALSDQLSDNLSAVGAAYNAEKARAEKAEERLKWLEGFLQAGGTSINTVSYHTVENHPDDTYETHFNFPFRIGISVETENRGCYEWVEFSNGAKGLCPAIDAAKIKYAEWINKWTKETSK
jgi:hypothetical protein